MEEYKIFNWNESNQMISEAEVRLKFPQPEYRVSHKLYKTGESRSPGTAREGIIFVIKGKCKCSFGDDDKFWIFLDSGQGVHFPEGCYQIQPLEDQDAEIVFVWNVLNMLREISSGNSGI